MKRIIRTPLQLKLLAEANANYPDGCIEGYFVLKTGRQRYKSYGYDTMALFIGRELLDVTEGIDNENDARIAIESSLTLAAQELDALISYFRSTLL